MTTTTALVSLRATSTDEYVPTNRLAVAPATFHRLCRESADGGLAGYGAPDAELHILRGDDDLAIGDDAEGVVAAYAAEYFGLDFDVEDYDAALARWTAERVTLAA